MSRASDRTGYRLEGVTMAHGGAASLPSEPTCVGAIQVPDGGAPIVIMHDGPTVGGYPKIAVLISADLPKAAQLCPGHRVRFQTATLEEAHEHAVRFLGGGSCPFSVRPPHSFSRALRPSRRRRWGALVRGRKYIERAALGSASRRRRRCDGLLQMIDQGRQLHRSPVPKPEAPRGAAGSARQEKEHPG